MSKYDLKTIQALYEIGLVPRVTFGLGSGYVPQEEFYFTPEEMLDYLEQGEAYILNRLDIDPEMCAKWRAAGGDALCGAMLKNGERMCERVVEQQLDFHSWVLVHRDDYCPSHRRWESRGPQDA